MVRVAERLGVQVGVGSLVGLKEGAIVFVDEGAVKGVEVPLAGRVAVGEGELAGETVPVGVERMPSSGVETGGSLGLVAETGV